MNIKQSVQEHAVYWFLSSMVVAFLAGFGAYETILNIAGRDGLIFGNPKIVRTLELKKVHLEGNEGYIEDPSVRVVIYVDGKAYNSYPKPLVMNNLSVMQPEKFLVYLDKEEFQLGFKLFLRDSKSGEIITYGSTQTHSITKKPVADDFDLQRIRGGEKIPSEVKAKVAYTVE